MRTVKELNAEARAAGVEDAYGFAEWLCDTQSHFGPVENMPTHELEEAWETAMGWWQA